MSRPNLVFFEFFFIFESLRDFVCVCFAVLFAMFWIFIRFNLPGGKRKSACTSGAFDFIWGCIKVFACCGRGGPLRLTAFGTLGCGALFLLRGTQPACKNRPLPLLRFGCFVRRTRLSCAVPHAWEAIRNGLKYKSLPLRLPRVRGSWRGHRPRLRGLARRQRVPGGAVSEAD